MAKKQHDADRNYAIREYLTFELRFVALLPIRFWRTGTSVGRDGETILPADAETERGQPILVENETQLRDLYRALLGVRRLAPKVRNAIMRELGRSQRIEKMHDEHRRTLAIRARIDERKEALKKKGQRGSLYEAALAEEAKERGLTVAALKGRLRKKRLHP
jgi:hypothetical protein